MNHCIDLTLPRRPWLAAFALAACFSLGATTFATQAAATPATATPAAGATKNVDAATTPAAAKDPGPPLAYVQAMYAKLNAVAQSSAQQAQLHKRIGDEMAAFMDYEALGARTLGTKTWANLTAAQRTEFVGLLAAMVQKTFVKRFKPGTKVTITYDPKVRMKKDGRAQVRTTIRIKRTSAAVYYSMVVTGGTWRVYDIVVDEVSQLATYKRSFRRILAKEGWKGLVARMKKST